MAYVRPSKAEDPTLLSPNLREADLIELRAASHRPPKETLFMGHTLGDPCKTIVGDTGNIVGMYGVTPVTMVRHIKLGVIWCLTSPELFEIKKQFIRHCREEIKVITSGYDKVFNYVHVKNTQHIRWIKAMGFDIADKPTKFGWAEEKFYYFEKVIK